MRLNLISPFDINQNVASYIFYPPATLNSKLISSSNGYLARAFRDEKLVISGFNVYISSTIDIKRISFTNMSASLI